MTELRVRQDTDFRFTVEQIGRLERALLSIRESAIGAPEVLEAARLVQYQEILRLREELDAALGFSADRSDLVMTLHGPEIGLGVAPASVIASTLDNIRLAVQTVSSYLSTGRLIRRGRTPETLSLSTDFQFVGVGVGSARLKLDLPRPRTLFPELDSEPVEQSVRLMLQAVGWISSDSGIDVFERSLDDEDLLRLLLIQVRRIAPKQGGTVRRIEFTGRLVDSENSYALSRKAVDRIRDALKKTSAKSEVATEEGKLRAVDVDSGVFQLRQRPDGKPDLRCEFDEDTLIQALEYLVGDVTVTVEGRQEYDYHGRPSVLVVEDIFESARST